MALRDFNLLSSDHYRRQMRPVLVVDTILKAVVWILMIAYCLSLLYLPIWMVLTSFRDYFDYNIDPIGWPQMWTLDNYAQAYADLTVDVTKGLQTITYNMWDLALFSVLYSAGTAFWNTFVTTCVAYVIAKYKFPGRTFLYSLGIVVMILPIIGSGAAGLLLAKALGVYDNMFLLILFGPSTAFSGFNFLLLHGTFKAMPWDYAESVFVDGGSHFTAFFKVYFPMVLPTFAVLFILSFLGSWNNYSTFMIMLPSTPNLAYGLYLFQGAAANIKDENLTTIMAGFCIVVIPTIALYFASQKLIMSNFNIGGLKG
jgi:multiple sugar transport system permease protein